ncbi:hypothetical protein [Paenibacillus abyssi]|uniref:Uncharacterized protein n=1 Tax=Paenibacillus abyssi TaxID=1340531 RepID=A0A917G166_9BACL|nr:hypothetical protein [Paenibacillus abyssi]GGG17621.1 hypothetical protein GCM10010916_38070 [Paenibacillus abyssi]
MWAIIFNIILWYLVIGHIQSWRWLIEARIKCVDLRDPMWSEFLNSLKGIASFTFLGTLFWLPAILLNMSRRLRRKTKVRHKTAMTWLQAFQKTVLLYKELQAWRRNDIQ